MRIGEGRWLVSLFVAMACGGSEFSSDGPDASSSSATGGGGSTVSTAVSTVSAGGAGGGGGAGARDAGVDARGGGGTGGAPKNSGDCQSAVDCGGDVCVELYPGGYRVCATKVPEATMCSVPPGQCCKSSDCASDARAPARCILGPVETYCGGPAPPPPANVCATDACASAADCTGPNAICAPTGTLGRKAARCMTGGCRFDRDCSAAAGGACVPVATGCCNQPSGLFCLYPGGCRSNADCKLGEQCETDGTRAFCGPAVPCPLAP